MARLNKTPFEIDIIDLADDGRGVGRREGGKTVFVWGALPGERVMATQTRRTRDFDQAVTVEVLQASPDRVQPRCPHYGTCGGCSLQHLDGGKQIEAKQCVLLGQFREAGVEPELVLPPLADAAWGYRRKGRLSVRRVEKKGRTLVGFRELDPRFVAELSECHTVIAQVGMKLQALSALVDSLQARHAVPQIEFIAGDDAVALVIRHLEPLEEADLGALSAFGREQGFAILLQPGGLDSVHPLWPADREDPAPPLEKLPVICGIAVVENAWGDAARVEAVPAQRLVERDAELLAESKHLMGRLLMPRVDVLIVDRIGKNISGAGMDPNVTGRPSLRAAGFDYIRIQKIIVRGLSQESGGNAAGIGNADFTTTRCVGEIDFVATYTNVFSARVMQGGKLPVVLPNDRLALTAALLTCNGIEPKEAMSRSAMSRAPGADLRHKTFGRRTRIPHGADRCSRCN